MKIINITLTVIFILTVYTWVYENFLYESTYEKYLIKEEVHPVFSIGSDIPDNLEDLKYGYPFDYSQNVPFFYSVLRLFALPMLIACLFLVWLYIPFFIILLGYHIFLIIKKQGNIKQMFFQLSVMAVTEFIFVKMLPFYMD